MYILIVCIFSGKTNKMNVWNIYLYRINIGKQSIFKLVPTPYKSPMLCSNHLYFEEVQLYLTYTINFQIIHKLGERYSIAYTCPAQCPFIMLFWEGQLEFTFLQFLLVVSWNPLKYVNTGKPCN